MLEYIDISRYRSVHLLEAIKGILSSISGEILPGLIGAILGVIFSVIFDDGLRNLKRNIKRKYKRLFTEKNEFTSHLFSFGDIETKFFVVDGDGQLEFRPDDIECRVINEKIHLPEDLQQIKNEIAAQETTKKEKGLDYKWNGPLYGLAKYRNSRTADQEEMTVLFTFYITDYFTFLATNMQLDKKLQSGETIREKYIPSNELETVQPFLANGFGVVLVVITSDENVILTNVLE